MAKPKSKKIKKNNSKAKVPTERNPSSQSLVMDATRVIEFTEIQNVKYAEEQIKKLALDEGADLIGICSADSIQDKEFSDAKYLLPGAKSIISIAIGFDDEIVIKYLSKQEYLPLCYEEGIVTKNLLRIGEKIKEFLEDKGFKAYRCNINFNYRNINTLSKSIIPALRKLIDLINIDNNPNIQHLVAASVLPDAHHSALVL